LINKSDNHIKGTSPFLNSRTLDLRTAACCTAENIWKKYRLLLSMPGFVAQQTIQAH